MFAKNGADEVGPAQAFVRAHGLRSVGEYAGLVGADGQVRLLAELSADPDRPEVRPEEAYLTLLASCQPGWTLRILQLFWPDPEPRTAFLEHVSRWGGEGAGERAARADHTDTTLDQGRSLLLEGLILHLQEAPLPFARRTILEFVVAGEESLAWWQGLGGLLAAHFVRFRPLEEAEIVELVRWVLNPEGLGE